MISLSIITQLILRLFDILSAKTQPTGPLLQLKSQLNNFFKSHLFSSIAKDGVFSKNITILLSFTFMISRILSSIKNLLSSLYLADYQV